MIPLVFPPRMPNGFLSTGVSFLGTVKSRTVQFNVWRVSRGMCELVRYLDAEINLGRAIFRNVRASHNRFRTAL